MSHLKGLQRTRLNRLVAQTFTYCTRTLCLPPTTFLLMWLWNKICFANVVGTQITRFLINMNQKISHLKGFHRTTPDGSGALVSVQCTRILCLPPKSFLFLWFQKKNCFANVLGTQIKRVPQDNTRWVRCTSLCIVYQNIVFASYYIYLLMIVE